MSAGRNAETDRVELLRELMEAHGNEVLRVVFGYVKDRHAAEDITQEVFVKVFDHLDSFRQESSYRTWIVRIAVNRAKDYLRAVSRRPICVEDLSFVEGDGSPERGLLRRHENNQLWNAVMNLPEMYREVVWLFYGRGMSLEEVADVTQVSVGSVKTRLYRARELLRRTWEGDGDHGRRA